MDPSPLARPKAASVHEPRCLGHNTIVLVPEAQSLCPTRDIARGSLFKGMTDWRRPATRALGASRYVALLPCTAVLLLLAVSAFGCWPNRGALNPESRGPTVQPTPMVRIGPGARVEQSTRQSCFALCKCASETHLRNEHAEYLDFVRKAQRPSAVEAIHRCRAPRSENGQAQPDLRRSRPGSPPSSRRQCPTNRRSRGACMSHTSSCFRRSLSCSGNRPSPEPAPAWSVAGTTSRSTSSPSISVRHGHIPNGRPASAPASAIRWPPSSLSMCCSRTARSQTTRSSTTANTRTSSAYLRCAIRRALVPPPTAPAFGVGHPAPWLPSVGTCEAR